MEIMKINKMKKTIILKESQIKKLIESNINEVSAKEIADILASVKCTGESLKSLVVKKLNSFGFEDVIIKFLGYSDDNDLTYIVHTEGPIFEFKAKSEFKGEQPCLHIYDVESYTKN